MNTPFNIPCSLNVEFQLSVASGVPRGGGLGVQTPPYIPKALQNRAKLNPIVETVKNC